MKRDWTLWNQQIEVDIDLGKLGSLIKEVGIENLQEKTIPIVDNIVSAKDFQTLLR
jgi:hypothetical protein